MLRITSGVHRGRLIQSLAGLQTRPTSERLRQAWLNSLQITLPESRILDLFSGSGALGLEALSRGAAFVIFVEENPKAVQIIQQNAKTLGFSEQIRVIPKKVEVALKYLDSEPPFDFVFMDPPYHQGYEEKILHEWPWQSLLLEGGRLCIESAHRKEGTYLPPPLLKISRDERYGDSQLTFYTRISNELTADAATETRNS
jgi:16S rRNA (guanine966-N2)-methyltransferase